MGQTAILWVGLDFFDEAPILFCTLKAQTARKIWGKFSTI